MKKLVALFVLAVVGCKTGNSGMNDSSVMSADGRDLRLSSGVSCKSTLVNSPNFSSIYVRVENIGGRYQMYALGSDDSGQDAGVILSPNERARLSIENAAPTKYIFETASDLNLRVHWSSPSTLEGVFLFKENGRSRDAKMNCVVLDNPSLTAQDPERRIFAAANIACDSIDSTEASVTLVKVSGNKYRMTFIHGSDDGTDVAVIAARDELAYVTVEPDAQQNLEFITESQSAKLTLFYANRNSPSAGILASSGWVGSGGFVSSKMRCVLN